MTAPVNSQLRWKRLSRDESLSVKDRLFALNAVIRPTKTFLARLMKKGTPSRLQFLATQLYEMAVARKEINDNLGQEIDTDSDTE
jgi:hypothetical protein